MPLPLPPSYRWEHHTTMSVLMHNYGAVASAHHDGRLVLRWAGREMEVRAASHGQAMRFAERWMAGRLDPHYDRWKKPLRPVLDNSAELAALGRLLAGGKGRPLPALARAIPEPPEDVEWAIELGMPQPPTYRRCAE